MNTDLYVITGAEGVGKTTIIPSLRQKLGDNYVIYDFDEVLRPYDFKDNWALDVLEKLIHNVEKNKESNKITVVAGLIRPYQLQQVAEKHNITSIKLLLLDLSIEEQSKRLHQRKGNIDLTNENKELIGFREFIKESKYEYKIVDTTNSNIEHIVDNIYSWISSNVE